MSIPTNNASNGFSSNGYLQLWVLDPPSIAGVVGGVSQDYLVFVAGAEDIQFADMAPITGQGFGYQPWQSDHALAPIMFKSQGFLGNAQPYKIEKVIAEDDIVSLKDIGHRMTWVAGYTLTATGVTFNPQNMFGSSILSWITAKFLYWRGSINIMVRAMDSTSIYRICRYNPTHSTTIQSDAGETWLDSFTFKEKIFNCPFISFNDCIQNVAYSQPSTSQGVSLQQVPNYILIPVAGTGGNVQIYASFGDDFSMGEMLPSPAYLS